jgi:hypothetical protein
MNNTINEYNPQTASNQKDSRTSSWLPTHLALWFCAIVFYGFGDLLTTAAVLAAGGHELNPVLIAATVTFGGGVWGPAVIKVATIVALAAIYLANCLRHRWAIPGLLTFAGLGLMINNLIAGTSL